MDIGPISVIIFQACLWLILGSFASGVVFALDKLKAWRSLAVCFSGICFCLYAPLGWLILWNIIPPFGEEDVCGGMDFLLALILTSCMFVGLSVAVSSLVRRLHADDTRAPAQEQDGQQVPSKGEQK